MVKKINKSKKKKNIRSRTRKKRNLKGGGGPVVTGDGNGNNEKNGEDNGSDNDGNKNDEDNGLQANEENTSETYIIVAEIGKPAEYIIINDNNENIKGKFKETFKDSENKEFKTIEKQTTWDTIKRTPGSIKRTPGRMYRGITRFATKKRISGTEGQIVKEKEKAAKLEEEIRKLIEENDKELDKKENKEQYKNNIILNYLNNNDSIDEYIKKYDEKPKKQIKDKLYELNRLYARINYLEGYKLSGIKKDLVEKDEKKDEANEELEKEKKIIIPKKE